MGLSTLPTTETTAVYSGVIAYVWMLAIIFLSTRPHWLDRLIGLPNMYQLHGILAIAALVLAWLHKLGTSSGGLIKQTGDLALIIFTTLMVYSLFFLAGWLTNRWQLINQFKIKLEKFFKHEISIWLHRLNLIAVILVFIHVQLIDYITSITPFIILFDGLSLLTAISYLNTKFNWDQRQRVVRLVQNQALSYKVRELTLQGRQLKKLDLRPGDFIFLSFPQLPKLREPHPFSLVTLPGQTSQLKLAIRADGDFTSLLAKVKKGADVKITGGFGRYQQFLNENNQSANLIMITGGIGVTPLFSLIANNLSRNMYLFYSAHRQEDLLYSKKLSDWQKLPQFTGYWKKGRFTDNFVIQHIPQNWENNSLFLLSGPIPLIHHWEDILSFYHIDAKNIFKEEFNW
ncbi:ferric reductase [Liquorilactobacillus uvarum DSM 19971]|uniref:Ferric reductase n=2 Tax=Liquorilactobacillus uvarum TaxID=303240 RepID=A0A0R1PNJ1_9LACO|nr:ferric reductase [Liquorilactobacillus uvarum DSM 19971]